MRTRRDLIHTVKLNVWWDNEGRQTSVLISPALIHPSRGLAVTVAVLPAYSQDGVEMPPRLAEGDRYKITHVPSGKLVDSQEFDNIDLAFGAIGLLVKIVDWTKPFEELRIESSIIRGKIFEVFESLSIPQRQIP